MIIAGVIGLVLLLGGLYWFLAKNAKADYAEAAVVYEQQIKQVRDDMNTKLDSEEISIYSPEAPPVFEEYGKKMHDVIANAPKPPRVLGMIPAGGANPEVTALTTAATNYANELRHINESFEYYTAVANAFKPIRNLGMFTVLDAEIITGLPAMWETFLAEFKTLEPPAELEAFKAEMILQAETLQTKFKELADGFSQRSIDQNDALAAALDEPTDTFRDTFAQSSSDTSNEAIDKVNQYYDELDAQLQ